MPSPNKNEKQKEYIARCMSSEEAKRDFPDSKQRVAFCHSKWENKGKSSGSVFVYKDTKTGELYYYSRKGIYKKGGRTLVFVKKSKGENVSDHILNKASQAYADKLAGYPPNCNEGYVEKDGKCVQMDEAEWFDFQKKKKNKKNNKKKNH